MINEFILVVGMLTSTQSGIDIEYKSINKFQTKIECMDKKKELEIHKDSNQVYYCMSFKN